MGIIIHTPKLHVAVKTDCLVTALEAASIVTGIALHRLGANSVTNTLEECGRWFEDNTGIPLHMEEV